MCNTYQQAVERECPCRYTFAQVGAEMAAESAWFRALVGIVIKALVCVVGVTIVGIGAITYGICMALAWASRGARTVLVWAYNAVFPVVQEPEQAVVAMVEEVESAAVVDWPMSKRDIVKVSK